MTQEQMERLAKYAADKYFDLTDENTKQYLTSDVRTFTNDYIKAYEAALSEIVKSQNSKFQEFGTDENSKLFK